MESLGGEGGSAQNFAQDPEAKLSPGFLYFLILSGFIGVGTEDGNYKSNGCRTADTLDHP